MITFVRTVNIAPGKNHQAISFAHQVTKMVEAKVGNKANIMMPIGGNPGRIGWVASYDTLAAFEAASTKLLPDPDYMKLVESSAAYFMPGSTHDELWYWLPPQS